MAPDPEHRLGELMESSNPSFETVMSCVFGIEPHETRTYLALVDQPGSTIDELEGPLERDRSTINRAMATLYERGLVRRDRRLLEGGGYVYQYTAVTLPEVRAILHGALDTWTATVHDVIDEFDGE
ncbi:helix-turn-helix domain-containing protein [Natronococcus sp. A-GB1]|uniref:helix-turn-helix domain-containing protein n=1 Tax=Natronococcus sp. A-GB1 TaxID=3037648 RepID=UPI00241DB683|nr:helix-turn-helix domain-containing protein [Natronococcus sp. A-GB1]MDG5757835.1 helix-turn-helix domain-containing protein [Natronococcus sp. A-GB1]